MLNRETGIFLQYSSHRGREATLFENCCNLVFCHREPLIGFRLSVKMVGKITSPLLLTVG